MSETHTTILRSLDFGIDFLFLATPLVLLAAITWRLAR
jgi:hypothetical protein